MLPRQDTFHSFAADPGPTAPPEGLVLWQVARYGIALLLLLGIVAVIYHFGPNIKQRWKFITPGSVFTVSVWLPSADLVCAETTVGPAEWTVSTYKEVLTSTGAGGQGFLRFLANSAIVSLAAKTAVGGCSAASRGTWPATRCRSTPPRGSSWSARRVRRARPYVQRRSTPLSWPSSPRSSSNRGLAPRCSVASAVSRSRRG